ncbi:MAG: DUF1329 domain-containing protein [Thiobacillaceae bacterium]
MNPAFCLSSVFMVGVLLATPVQAEVSAAEAAKLGSSLTPLGAEKSGNSVGTIPAWDGGLTKPVAGFKPGGHYPDPYAADKVLFSIASTNVDQYRERLTPGQVALLKKYPNWKMNVYPAHRSATYPRKTLDQSVANAPRAQLVGDGVTGALGGIPFPIPKDGLEAIWNTLLRYRGDAYATNWSQVAVTRDGDYTPVRFEYEYDFHYGNLTKPDKEREPNKLLNFLQTVTAPARLAGQVLLVHETVDQVKQPRTAWVYSPGQRRVRLAPNVAYDNPGTAADGLRTNDDFGMYNGATDRYDWKLLGKREMYVPYNSYKLSGNTLSYADVLQAGHLNPAATRYELHRVWVVEANLKPGTSHIYKKRVFYIDEDSWAVLVTDQYDARNELWRVAEQHSINFYDVPMFFGTVEVHHDLQSGRYIAMGLRNQESRVFEPIASRASDFTPQGLRGIGTR